MEYWNQYRIEVLWAHLRARDVSKPPSRCSEVPPKQFKPDEPAYQDVHVRRPQAPLPTIPPRLKTPRNRKPTTCFDGDSRVHPKYTLTGGFRNHTWIDTNHRSLPHIPNNPFQYETEKGPPQMIRLATAHARSRSRGTWLISRRRVTTSRAVDAYSRVEKGRLPVGSKTTLALTGALLLACNEPKGRMKGAQCQPSPTEGSNVQNGTNGEGGRVEQAGDDGTKRTRSPGNQTSPNKDRRKKTPELFEPGHLRRPGERSTGSRPVIYPAHRKMRIN